MWNLTIGLVAALVLGIASRDARADDGRIEINQARALAGGVTPGDAPGFPVTISAPGSYVLTSNLATAPAGVGIVASVAGVAIDLNGFEIVGPVVCTGLGSAVSCSAGTGPGIFLGDNSTVRDGRVRGFHYGLHTGNRAQIRRLIAESNGTGIVTLGGSIISESIAFQNGGQGINALGVDSDSLIEASIASSNKFTGFFSDGSATVAGCAAYDNGGSGIASGAWSLMARSSLVRDSSAYLNEDRGIIVGYGSVVSDNAAYQNVGHGITASPGSTVQRNSVASNTLFGLALYSDVSYRENTISGNGGTVAGGVGVNMGSNSCNGAATCP